MTAPDEFPEEPEQDYENPGNSTLLEMIAQGNVGGPNGLCPLDGDALVPGVHIPERLGGVGGGSQIVYTFSQLASHSLMRPSGSPDGLTTVYPDWVRPTTQNTNKIYMVYDYGAQAHANHPKGSQSKYTYNGGTVLPANQYAEVLAVGSILDGNDAYAGVVLKSSPNDWRGIYIQWRETQVAIAVNTSTNLNDGWASVQWVPTPGAYPNNDVLRAELYGDTIILKKNGVVQGQRSSSLFQTLPGNRAGINLDGYMGATVRDFKAGSITKTVTGTPPRGSICTAGTSYPGSPFDGDHFINTNTGQIYVWSD